MQLFRRAEVQRRRRVLERLGIDTSGWCDLVQKFGKLFKRAAGTAESMALEATRRGIGYMHAPGVAIMTPTCN